MSDDKHEIVVGNRIRGKNSELVAVVVKVLDAGYLMVHEEEFDMDLNIHHSEVVIDALNPVDFFRIGPAKKSDQAAKKSPTSMRVDLHLEKIPDRLKGPHIPALESQQYYLKERLATALREGVSQITIIHGKGSGILHKKCLALLKSYPQCRQVKILKVALEAAHGIEVSLK